MHDLVCHPERVLELGKLYNGDLLHTEAFAGHLEMKENSQKLSALTLKQVAEGGSQARFQ